MKTNPDGSYRYLDCFTDTALVNLINAAKALVRGCPTVVRQFYPDTKRLARCVEEIER